MSFPVSLEVFRGGATALAVTALLLLPFFDRAPVRAVLIVAVSVACALWHLYLRPVVRSPVEHVAWSFALVSAGWSVAVAAVAFWRRIRHRRSELEVPMMRLALVAAVYFGVVAGVMLGVLLAMRCAFVLAELVNGGPGAGTLDATFTSDGLWSLICLFTGCVVSLAATGDARLSVCTFLLGVMVIAWAGLLGSPFVPTETGGYARSKSLLSTLVLQSLWLLATTWMVDRVDRRGSRVLDTQGVPHDPSKVGASSRMPPRPGLRFCSEVLAIAIAIAVCYHIVVPHRTSIDEPGWSSVACFVVTVLVWTACRIWLRRSWSVLTAEVGLGHLSLAICSAATLLVPRSGVPMREQYPMMFTAIMIGFCVSAGVCAWIALAGIDRNPIDHRCKAEARHAPVARRFAFVNAALAFLVGVVMMVWPRLPTVATMDDSLERVAGGMAANLTLLLVVLWCGRRLRQPAFQVMTVLTVLLAGGFLLVRLLPFSSSIG